MKEIERVCFYMYYKDDDKYEEEIGAMKVMEEHVQYLDQKYEEFFSNSITYIRAVKDMVNREEIKMLSREEGLKEGIAEGKAVGRKEGKKEGIKEGEIVGIEKEKAETVKRMLIKNYDTKEISECTGLSIKKIKKIKEEMAS